MYSIADPEPESAVEESVPVNITDSDSMLKQVHGGRIFHYRPRKTWQLLGKYFPGRKVPYSKVMEFCRECGRCQKDKKAWVQDIKPVVRTVIPETHRSRLGIDTLTISPAHEDGYHQSS